MLRDCNILSRLGGKSDFALVCAGVAAQIAMRKVSCLASLLIKTAPIYGGNMRKVLLATAAFIGLAAAGNVYAAASTPLTVNVGGTTDFVAGTFSSQNHAIPGSSNTRDFESLYNLNFDVDGKTGNGIEYGGNLLLSNAPDASNAFEGASNGVNVDSAYVHMAGAFGKIQLGDSHGATDLVVSGAPTVGEGQVTGRYTDFLDTQTFAKTFALGVDGTDHSTNVTYFTPKVGDEDNKIQVGVSYVPEMYNYGGNVVKYNSGGDAVSNLSTNSPYRDVVKGAVEIYRQHRPRRA